AALHDPRVQAASMHEEAHDLLVRVAGPFRARLAELDALELAVADPDPFADERVQLDTSRHEISPRLVRPHREAGLRNESLDLLDLDQRDLLAGMLSVPVVGIAIAVEPGLRDSQHGLDGFCRSPLLCRDENMLDPAHMPGLRRVAHDSRHRGQPASFCPRMCSARNASITSHRCNEASWSPSVTTCWTGKRKSLRFNLSTIASDIFSAGQN